ncbi:nitrilase-related carbon-nitrogen hydrolase [Benzoatithermus flavus]|uniref:Nitrilase-related carbon-nitrogen hydrolase n=1 Tax=Benzoatithermus flavus TaxID=3108223 RepID=A0ABU8XUB4_9PROT
MRIAALHGAPHSGDVAANLARIDGSAAAAAARGAELLVLPQFFLAGAPSEGPSASQLAQTSDGPGARALAAIARARAVAILCGYLELCTGRLYDSALLVDAAGCARANYRRTHLRPAEEAAGLTRGHWLSVAPLGQEKLGILIGADIEAPEPARALALAGSRILVVLAAHGPEAAIVGSALLRTRAFENACPLVYANGSTAAGAPRSCLLGQDGSVLAEAEAAGLVVADLPVAAAPPASRPRRRPRLYQKLAAAIPSEDGPRV